MSSRSSQDDGDTPLGPTEMQALRRLAEPPLAHQVLPTPEALWASRYRILESIGQGGMGEVFLARDILLDRLVALKVLRSTSDESLVDPRGLLREARAAARAEHERIARVYDAGMWNEQAFIAMEYVRGETLRARMKRDRATASEILAIVQQLLEGLQALHERGLVHRDLKPENVMVTPEGALRILDLGIARRVAIGDTKLPSDDVAGTVSLGFGIGTPGYMAPEQWRNRPIDARADLFALGVIAHELVVGRAPFRGSTNFEIREQTLTADPMFDDPRWTDVPAELTAAIRRALARDPEQRFQNVGAMVESLSPLLPPSPRPLSAPSAPSTRPSSEEKTPGESLPASVLGNSQNPLSRRRPKRLVLASLVGASLIITVAGVASRLRRPSLALPGSPGVVRLAGASYVMGSTEEEIATACASYPHGCPHEVTNETPPRPTTVAPFELDVREVTNDEFAQFLTTIGPALTIVEDLDRHYRRFVRYTLQGGDDYLLYDSDLPSAGIELSAALTFDVRPGFERLPVTLVTWLGARLFCKNALKRLPTEAEWELAAGGVEKRAYPWGNGLPSCGRVHIPSDGTLPVLNSEECENTRTTPFPIMTASQDNTPDGIYDMGGNVMEWVDDSALLDGDEATYVRRLRAESPGILRGGAYNSSYMTRTTSRTFRLPFNEAYNVGFRCAKSVVLNQ